MANYMKLPQLAQRLDVSQQTARRMVKDGRIPAVFIGNAYRVSEADVAAYLENARVEPGGGPTLFDQAPEPPARLELAHMFEAGPAARRKALEAASTEAVTAYVADLERAKESAIRAPEAGDTEDTRRTLAEYVWRLGELHREAEDFARRPAHAGVA